MGNQPENHKQVQMVLFKQGWMTGRRTGYSGIVSCRSIWTSVQLNGYYFAYTKTKQANTGNPLGKLYRVCTLCVCTCVCCVVKVFMAPFCLLQYCCCCCCRCPCHCYPCCCPPALAICPYLPRTTNRTGWLVKASCVVKSLAVTWHSQRPSSKSNVAERIHSEQSPPICIGGGCKSKCRPPLGVEDGRAAHSYFLA